LHRGTIRNRARSRATPSASVLGVADLQNVGRSQVATATIGNDRPDVSRAVDIDAVSRTGQTAQVDGAEIS
jgi:hypothetical protein